MSVRLGEMLLKIGALTEDELDQVLNAQSIYGGRLGTNLVEMGLIPEEELAHLLSEQLLVPCVEPAELDDIPKSVLQSVPVDLVQRFRALPIAVDGKRLTLAIANPSDCKALDEIGFASGLVVKPRICSELRLGLALERYYGIKRPYRYIPVQGGARTRFSARAADADPVGDRLLAAVNNHSAAGRLTVKEVAERLSVASVELDVVQTVLSYLSGEFDRGAFLRLKAGTVQGVEAVADGMPVQGFTAYSATLDQANQLRRVVEEKCCYLGEMASAGPDGALLRAMGGKIPAMALLVPISIGGQVAALICATDEKGRLGGGLFELQRVAVMAELSFEMLSLKKRISTV